MSHCLLGHSLKKNQKQKSLVKNWKFFEIIINKNCLFTIIINLISGKNFYSVWVFVDQIIHQNPKSRFTFDLRALKVKKNTLVVIRCFDCGSPSGQLRCKFFWKFQKKFSHQNFLSLGFVSSNPFLETYLWHWLIFW